MGVVLAIDHVEIKYFIVYIQVVLSLIVTYPL